MPKLLEISSTNKPAIFQTGLPYNNYIVRFD